MASITMGSEEKEETILSNARKGGNKDVLNINQSQYGDKSQGERRDKRQIHKQRGAITTTTISIETLNNTTLGINNAMQ